MVISGLTTNRLLRQLPGFRTGEPWKAVFALTSYALLVVFAVTAVIDGSTREIGLPSRLTNGGFESGTGEWNMAAQATIDTSTSDAHGGHASLKLAATAAWQASIQAVLVKAGRPYDFVGWGRSKASDGHFSIFSYAANGALIGTPFDRIFRPTGQWIKVKAVYIPPAGAVQAQVLLQNAAAGTYWYDDIALTPGDNALANPGFEDGSDNWSLNPHASVESSATDAHSGDNALKLTAVGPWQETYQSVTVIGGQAYSFSAWGRSQSAGGHMSLISFDSNDERVGSFDLLFAGDNRWHFVSGTYIQPLTAIRVDVALQNSTPGGYWFDDVRLAPTDSVIDNGGFEDGAAGWRLVPQATLDSAASEAHGGKTFLILRADAPWEGASQSPPVLEGQTYEVRGWGRAATDGGHLTIISFDASGREVGDRVDLTFPGTNAWTLIEGQYRPPAGTVRIDLWLQSSVSGIFAFDDISLTPR